MKQSSRQAEEAKAIETTNAQVEKTTFERDTQLASADSELGLQMEQTNEQNAALKGSMLAGAQNTYLSQLAAEGKLLDTMQEGRQAQGTLTSRGAAMGLKGRTTLQDVVGRAYTEQQGLIRKQIDSARDTNILQFKTQARALNKAQNAYAPGSAYMDYYYQKREAVANGAQLETDYANMLLRQSQGNKGIGFMTDLFDSIGFGVKVGTGLAAL